MKRFCPSRMLTRSLVVDSTTRPSCRLMKQIAGFKLLALKSKDLKFYYHGSWLLSSLNDVRQNSAKCFSSHVKVCFKIKHPCHCLLYFTRKVHNLGTNTLSVLK